MGQFLLHHPGSQRQLPGHAEVCEIYFSAAGRRVFNVAINGQTVISNLDIYAKVGKNVAYDVVIPVTATNGAITVKFTSTKDYGKVSAILVKSM
nr:malectin domain-containing carbohydrate-binding protein [Geotalea toluenoxydans]